MYEAPVEPRFVLKNGTGACKSWSGLVVIERSSYSGSVQTVSRGDSRGSAQSNEVFLSTSTPNPAIFE